MATAKAGSVLPSRIGSSPAMGYMESELSYTDVYPASKNFSQVEVNMSAMSGDRATLILSIEMNADVLQGDWVPVDVDESACMSCDDSVFNVVSDPLGHFVRGQMRRNANNDTVLWLYAGASIKTGSLLMVRISNTQRSLSSTAVVVSGCNVSKVQSVMIGLHSSVPTIMSLSSCNTCNLSPHIQ